MKQCGNGQRLVQLPKFNEACDDGNLVNGDGCNNLCKVESDYICTHNGVTESCLKQCGNGYRIV